MTTKPSDSAPDGPLDKVDKETQRQIAREGGARALSENVGHGFNADNPPGDARKPDRPGKSLRPEDPEDQTQPLKHAGATENAPDDKRDQVVKGRPPLKELAELGGDEQGNAEDQDEDYQPRDAITPG